MNRDQDLCAGTRRQNGRKNNSRKDTGIAKPFPIVGLGASAGGLEAMTQLLRHVPGGTGMAFVLVQHLDPTHESALTALLGRTTTMPVSEARRNMKLEPDHLYVIPPNKIMGISARRLKLKPRTNGRQTHAAIDHFLQSLARESGKRRHWRPSFRQRFRRHGGIASGEGGGRHHHCAG